MIEELSEDIAAPKVCYSTFSPQKSILLSQIPAKSARKEPNSLLGCSCPPSSETPDVCRVIEEALLRIYIAETKAESIKLPQSSPESNKKQGGFLRFFAKLKSKSPSVADLLRKRPAATPELLVRNKGFSSKETKSLENPPAPAKSQNIERSHSIMALDRDEQVIAKDVRRTFQNVPFFMRKETLDLLHQMLSYLTEISKFGYVQGMNFWVAAIIFHLSNRGLSVRLIDYFWDNLCLEGIYSTTTFEEHIQLSKLLFKAEMPKFWRFLSVGLKIDLKLILLDWFFSLGFNKIPLSVSGKVLSNLAHSGWYFFYRMILAYFLNFENFHLEKITSKIDKDLVFDYNILIKDHFKSLGSDWDEVIDAACRLAIDDSLIEKTLRWNANGMFEKMKEN